jgi:hypothetical protein
MKGRAAMDTRRETDTAACGCEVHTGERMAVAVDPEIKASNLTRLRRIEGQIRGLQKMVEEDRYCAETSWSRSPPSRRRCARSDAP